MNRYAMTFHATVEAPDYKTAMQTASRIEDAVACDEVLMSTGDYVKEFDLDDCELLEEEDEE